MLQVDKAQSPLPGCDLDGVKAAVQYQNIAAHRKYLPGDKSLIQKRYKIIYFLSIIVKTFGFFAYDFNAFVENDPRPAEKMSKKPPEYFQSRKPFTIRCVLTNIPENPKNRQKNKNPLTFVKIYIINLIHYGYAHSAQERSTSREVRFNEETRRSQSGCRSFRAHAGGRLKVHQGARKGNPGSIEKRRSSLSFRLGFFQVKSAQGTPGQEPENRRDHSCASGKESFVQTDNHSSQTYTIKLGEHLIYGKD
jgi:hypothetical protein